MSTTGLLSNIILLYVTLRYFTLHDLIIFLGNVMKELSHTFITFASHFLNCNLQKLIFLGI